jgi:hypothetical protein
MTKLITPQGPGWFDLGQRVRAAPEVEEEEPAGWQQRLRELASPPLVVAAVYVVLAVWLFHPIWRNPAGNTLGAGAGDGGLFIWYIRWTAYALTHGLNPLHSDFINHPDGVNVMWNTSVLLPSLLLAPVTWLFGATVSFNLMLTGALAGSAFTGYLAARRFVTSHLAAALGGLVYGFSPAMYAQSRGHLHMTLLILPPLLLLALDHILVRQRRPPWQIGAALGLGAFCQLLTGEEVLAFTAITGLLLTIVLAALYPREVAGRARYAALALGTSLAVFLPLAAWPLLTQLFGPQHIEGNIQEGVRLASDLLGFVLPNPNLLVAPDAAVEVSREFDGGLAELNAYVGVPMLTVAVFAAVRWWSSPLVRVATIMAGLVMLLSLGSLLHVGGEVTSVGMPWGLVDDLPLLESGVPNRLMLLAWLFLGLLLAVFVDRLQGEDHQRGIALAAVTAVLISLLPQGEVGGGPVRDAPFFSSEALERIPDGSVALVLPFPTRMESIAMFWQAQAGFRFKLPGGYSVLPGDDGRPQFGPDGTKTSSILAQVTTGARATRVAGDLRRDLVADLERWQVRSIVLGPMPEKYVAGRARLRELITGLVGRAPEEIGGVYFWPDVDPVALRETPDPDRQPPAAKQGQGQVQPKPAQGR